MLYRLLLLLTLSFSFSDGLGFTPLSIIQRRPQGKASLVILSGWFDFKPFHGGSAKEEDLDEQWEAQQEILRARRSGGLDKVNLKKKYASKKKTEEDIVVPPLAEQKIPNTSSDKPPAPFKMPWEK